MMTFVYSILVLGIMGFGIGVALSVAAKKFEVKADPKVEEIIKALPGANCGMCGYAGCAAYAHAIVEQHVSFDLCVPGRKGGVGEKVKEIMTKASSENANTQKQTASH
ncbi:MAG: RnfABCDGE type electron transport complex subunit B [Thermotogae bacterium]|jgi:electron transport complex protein RnfB|nr:RnfABCDGE type electron transport complex subunit B [Thermotogota bacterium]MCL5032752.1 RnfABCDGE type electron transport complex subunit B [Thermotogota bacterium]